jgi:hypothetical protein
VLYRLLEYCGNYYHVLDSKTPGPRFDINDTIRAIVLEFQSTYLFTLAYDKMYHFYRQVRPSVGLAPPSLGLAPPSVGLVPLSLDLAPPSVSLAPPSLGLAPPF